MKGLDYHPAPAKMRGIAYDGTKLLRVSQNKNHLNSLEKGYANPL